MQTISAAEAVRMIENAGSRIFTVEFVKRTDGSVRTLTGRRGVRKGVNGKGRNFDPKSKGLLPVCDLAVAKRAKKNAAILGVEQTDIGHRLISVEGIRRLAINGEVFAVA